VLRKAAVTVLGSLLLMAGAVALLLPGPGLLLLLSGLVVLSREYAWAARHVRPVRERAIAAASAGVATYPRLALSACSALLLITAGVVWWIDPAIPPLGPLGPRLPLGGWETGVSIVASGIVALALLGYSRMKFRGTPPTSEP
jgi:putative transmembrane protein PGPGW